MAEILWELLGKIFQPAMETMCIVNKLNQYFNDGEVVGYDTLYQLCATCTQTPDLLIRYLFKEGMVERFPGNPKLVIVRKKKQG